MQTNWQECRLCDGRHVNWRSEVVEMLIKSIINISFLCSPSSLYLDALSLFFFSSFNKTTDTNTEKSY